MNEAARHSRRQRSSSGPVTAGHSTAGTAVGTGTSIDSQSAAPLPEAEGVGQLLIPMSLHRRIKAAAATEGKKLNEFATLKLRELFPEESSR